MLQGLLYIILLIFSPEIFAGMFDPPPTDKSVGILGMIFGSNIGYIYLGGVPNPVANSIMEKFNFIVVMVGTIVVSYVAVLSVVNTAQEGETMGKRWSAVWTPLRTVSGMVLMIPSPASGYSIIQVTVTWIILQGIGAADQVWNIALDGLKQGVSATLGAQQAANQNPGNANVSTLSTAADQLTQQLLNASVCMQALQQFGQTGDHAALGDWLNQKASSIKQYTLSSNGAIASSDHTSANASATINFGVNDPSYTLGFQTATCGSVSVEGSASKADFGNALNNLDPSARDKMLTDAAEQILDTKITVISNMLSILQPLAQSIVANSLQGLVLSKDDSSENHPDLKRAAAQSTILQPSGYYAAATQAYASILSNLVVPVDSQNLSNDLSSAISQGENLGWIVAGAYYFVFDHNAPANVFSDIYTAPTTMNIPACGTACTSDLYNAFKYDLDPTPTPNDVFNKLSLSDAERQSLNTWLSTGYIYLMGDKFAQPGALSLGTGLDQSSGNPIVDALASPMYGEVVNLISMMNGNAGTTGGDVLLAHSQFGRDMMRTMEGVWIAILLLMPAIFALSMIPFVVGPAALTLGMLMTALGLILPVIGMVWSIGASLAIYAPLIPFIIFTTATVGWLIAVIEAIIAAPLIALGIIMPSGDELGKLEVALMILANIFLRPMLMIIGFLIAGRVYNSIIHLVEECMLQVLNTIDVKTLFSSIVILFVYASFVISLTNASFSIIYGLPDKVLRWMGGSGGGSEAPDMSAAQAAKQGISGAAQQVGSSGAEIGGAVHKHAAAGFKANVERNEQKKEEKKEKERVGDAARNANNQMMEAERAAGGKKALEAHKEMVAKGKHEEKMGGVLSGLKGAVEERNARMGKTPEAAEHAKAMKDVFAKIKKEPPTGTKPSGKGGGTV